MLLRLPSLDGTSFAACGLESAWSEAARRHTAARGRTVEARRARLELGLALEALRREVPAGEWQASLKAHGIHARTARRALADARAHRASEDERTRKSGEADTLSAGRKPPSAPAPLAASDLLSRPWGPAGGNYDFRTGKFSPVAAPAASGRPEPKTPRPDTNLPRRENNLPRSGQLSLDAEYESAARRVADVFEDLEAGVRAAVAAECRRHVAEVNRLISLSSDRSGPSGPRPVLSAAP